MPRLIPHLTQTTFDANSANNRLNSCTIDQSPASTLCDPAGNMISEGSQTYTYDGAGRMIAVGVDNLNPEYRLIDPL